MNTGYSHGTQARISHGGAHTQLKLLHEGRGGGGGAVLR